MRELDDDSLGILPTAPGRAVTNSTFSVHEVTVIVATPVLLASAEKVFLRWNLNSRHERIAARAYFNPEKRGFAAGHPLDDWLEAEVELLTDEAVAHQPEE